ncbi:MAG TPA: AAA family ATPase, partial [Gemmataceae bacterium]|nr:AAA family ATPase [Gemmataceae bacterium]
MEPAARPPNPFDDYIVTDPWQAAVTDVPEIHASAYALCCQARAYVSQENKTTSVLLHGQIGSGKTHLLARLRRHWTGVSTESYTIPPPGIIFVAHRFAPSPTRIWRQLRRSLVNDLLRPDPEGSCQLQRLLLRQLARVRPADTYLPHWWEYMQLTYAGPGDLERELGGLFDKLDQECDLGRSLCTMLLSFILDRQGRDVRDWLRGAALPDETLVALGLPRAPEEPEDNEAEARDFILALSRLAGRDHPLVICFDQIEALQVHPKDQAGLFAFGQLVAALHDQTSNVLMVSCVQSSFLVQLREYVAGQNYNRLAKYEGSLDLLNWDQSVRL